MKAKALAKKAKVPAPSLVLMSLCSFQSMEFQPEGFVFVELRLPDGSKEIYRWNKITTCIHNLFRFASCSLFIMTVSISFVPVYISARGEK